MNRPVLLHLLGVITATAILARLGACAVQRGQLDTLYQQAKAEPQQKPSLRLVAER